MGESRTDLLAWINELLQTSYVKIEQCGAGGAYCQIIDSIFGNWSSLLLKHVLMDLCSMLYYPVCVVTCLLVIGDVPMSRVKMNAKHEYEFLANYKILQNVFKAHKIDKVNSAGGR